MKRLIIKTAIALSAMLTLTLNAQQDNVKPVKYVFLFIGDGLSIPQRMMTEEFLKKTENRGLLMNKLPYQAITHTSAANAFITDSAASGTAIACGEKTNNGRIGMDASGERKLVSVAEVARDSGRKVGIISSVTLNHATPAAFYGHNTSRGNAYQIGLDLIASKFDYFGGGGIAGHNHKDDKMYKGDIYELAKEAGYTVSFDRKGFEAIKPGSGKVISMGAKDALPYAIDMKENNLRLADFTRQGIEMINNPKGFFMMVEGGKIDWMCHANDAATTLREVIDFDEAIQVGYEFYQKHPEETLIVVTGDHETGGLTLGFGGTGYKSYIENLKYQTCSLDVIKSKLRKVKATTFDDLKPVITEVSGLIFPVVEEGKERPKGGLNLSASEEKALADKFARYFKEGKFTGENSMAGDLVRLLNNKSAVAWTSGAHTALPVQTTAIGPGGDLFSNMLDNTDIAKRLKMLVR